MFYISRWREFAYLMKPPSNGIDSKLVTFSVVCLVWSPLQCLTRVHTIAAIEGCVVWVFVMWRASIWMRMATRWIYQHQQADVDKATPSRRMRMTVWWEPQTNINKFRMSTSIIHQGTRHESLLNWKSSFHPTPSGTLVVSSCCCYCPCAVDKLGSSEEQELHRDRQEDIPCQCLWRRMRLRWIYGNNRNT